MRLKKYEGNYVKRQHKVIVVNVNKKLRAVRKHEAAGEDVRLELWRCPGEPDTAVVPVEVFGLADTRVRVVFYNQPPKLVTSDEWQHNAIDVLYEGCATRSQLVKSNGVINDEHCITKAAAVTCGAE